MQLNNLTADPDRRALPAGDAVTAIPLTRALPAVEASLASAQDYVSLATYWHILQKRRRTVLSVALVLTTLVAIGSFSMKPIYRGVSRVQVEAETPLIQSLNDLYQKEGTDDAFLQTQIQVLKSDNLAWKTIEQLHLQDNANFINPKVLLEKKLGDSEAQKAFLISEFKDRLSVDLTPKTRMLIVGFESRSSRLAALVSTTLVENYIDYNFRQKYDATRQASGWMEQQLDDLKAKVETSQQALVDYERQYSITNTSDKQNVQELMLSDVSRDLTTAQSDRIQKESLYTQIRDNRTAMAALLHDDLLQTLQEKSAELKEQYLEALSQYGPKFPKVVRLQEQVTENQAQIGEEQDRVFKRIASDYQTAAGREKLAAAAVTRQKEALGSLNQLLVQHNILQREFDGNQQLYASLMQRLKDATVSAGLRSTNIHMVDSALTVTEPVRPKKMLNIAIGMLAGLVLGIMLAFVQEAVDRTIKNVDELENIVAAPALGVIPVRASGRSAYGLIKRRNSHLEDGKTELGLTITKNPTSVLAEAYRSLRTAVLLSTPGRPPKSILITSAQASEGKSVTALNLAQALAQRKGQVLLADCDLRKPIVAKTLGLENDKGMSTVLTGTHTLEQALQQYEGLPNLWVLPSGPIAPNPADLLSSDAMSDLIESWSKRFEHVVIDSPPVLAVTDAAILAGMVDGIVLVAAAGHTARGAITRTCKILTSAGGRILGVALNKFDMRQQGYYDGYYYYYSAYGYGKKQRYGTADVQA
jgi:succinoglycan biosynthesis transport protein ExoP